MHITRAFLDGMKETAAQEIHPINVTDRHIEFCRGCFACKYNGGHCVLEGSNVLSQEQFEQDGGTGEVASWCNTVTVRNVHPNTTVAFRVNNLSGSVSDLTLNAYAQTASFSWFPQSCGRSRTPPRPLSAFPARRLDLDGPAAEAFINAVRNGEHRPALGRAAQRLQHAGLGLGI